MQDSPYILSEQLLKFSIKCTFLRSMLLTNSLTFVYYPSLNYRKYDPTCVSIKTQDDQDYISSARRKYRNFPRMGYKVFLTLGFHV